MKTKISRVFSSSISELSDSEFDKVLCDNMHSLGERKATELIDSLYHKSEDDLRECFKKFDSFLRTNHAVGMSNDDSNIIIDYCMSKNKLDVVLVAHVVSIIHNLVQLKIVENMVSKAINGAKEGENPEE